MSATATTRPSIEQIWGWLAEVPDPEIPVISVVDLGIVRNVAWSEKDADECIVTVTPTYTGCPANEVIAQSIWQELRRHGIPKVSLQAQLSPAWTTDWLSERGKQQLREFGIAPPVGSASENAGSSPFSVLKASAQAEKIPCPRCGAEKTELISQFGSTPCKSLHRCLSCFEPFDYFKCH